MFLFLTYGCACLCWVANYFFARLRGVGVYGHLRVVVQRDGWWLLCLLEVRVAGCLRDLSRNLGGKEINSGHSFYCFYARLWELEELL